MVGGVSFIVYSTSTLPEKCTGTAGSRDIQYIYLAQGRFSAKIPKLVDAVHDQGGNLDPDDL